MTIDPRKLKPGELVRLLNSTPLGEVLSERQLHRHRSRAGFRIGDGRTVDLLRYVAWLVLERHRPRPEPTGLTGYEAMKERAAQRNRALALLGRDIGQPPAVANPDRRSRAQRDFRFFCEGYFPQTFHLPWSPDHLKVVAKIEQAVLEGGLFAMAMPRGSGKTSLCETACLWAIAYGHREYVALIGSDEEHAANMLDSIKVELETNDALLDDFPEVVYPIRALEGIHQRAAGQLCQGKQTYIGWTAKEIALPTMPGSRASGSIMSVAGITGRIRGMKHKRVDGTSVRPLLVLIDDPQTDESARSPSQCVTRERILSGAILGLAGPGRKIAGLMTLTVVRPDDLADRILDREKHPQWQGQRTKMVYSFPTSEALWAGYADLWRAGMRAERGIAEATEFYRARREAMDAGAVVAWPQRHHPDELSAVQHAMNLRLDRGDAAFWAEYQNEPLPEVVYDGDLLTPDDVCRKLNNRKRYEIPQACTTLTAFIDVQDKALYYVVVAWAAGFDGYVVDYGTEPGQKEAYFTLRELRRTLARAAPGAGPEGAIYAGLERLTAALIGRDWSSDDGAALTIDRVLIDANWGETTDLVKRFCRQCAHPGVVMPSHGRFVGASSVPFHEYTLRPGEKAGENWRIPPPKVRGIARHVAFDANYWKTMVHRRLRTALGDRGCLSLWGAQPERHRMFAEHVTAETPVRVSGRGRTVEEWKQRPGADNHLFDCLVGCTVAASMEGIALREIGDARPRKQPRSWAALQQAARRRREAPA
ncbi:Phage terminase large subunit (GpA) [Phycisphaerae bacterium RAS1]|nr:Phage terminase large subunit (GpA) [Phycisphaerae bacterium RAS1]